MKITVFFKYSNLSSTGSKFDLKASTLRVKKVIENKNSRKRLKNAYFEYSNLSSTCSTFIFGLVGKSMHVEKLIEDGKLK